MKLYFVRHGKTEWNLEGRFQGANADSPLLPEALEDIAELGEHLSDINFDKVFSSDQKRAVDTAQLLIDKHDNNDLTLETTESLREWNLGILENKKISNMEAIYPKQMYAFRHNLVQFNATQFRAESVFQVTHRIADFVKSLQDSNVENVLIIGHGASLTASIRHLLGYPSAQLRRAGGLSNASLTILETQDFKQFDLVTWNDKEYLEKKKAI
ncbi:histidine phosphatase family protein [Streptococcus hillyeri]|uniref:Histidine phosphatase family protein n=1 Tax=Streptococcus hillyeri TaxID=2282420 RepID=A0A3L9DVA0_9STRE|nr:histidine phosphatase family protein [Streptococcus hillyeri]RLY04168.1 histidine phosphatase family protein [Streptococcus hillyeri]